MFSLVCFLVSDSLIRFISLVDTPGISLLGHRGQGTRCLSFLYDGRKVTTEETGRRNRGHENTLDARFQQELLQVDLFVSNSEFEAIGMLM